MDILHLKWLSKMLLNKETWGWETWNENGNENWACGWACCYTIYWHVAGPSDYCSLKSKPITSNLISELNSVTPMLSLAILFWSLNAVLEIIKRRLIMIHRNVYSFLVSGKNIPNIHKSHSVSTKFRTSTHGVQRNQVHSINVWCLEILNPDFQPILTRSKF